MPTVVVTYFNARTRGLENRDHPVEDLERPTLEAVVDLFDAQIGTVFHVKCGDQLLYRAAVTIRDLT